MSNVDFAASWAAAAASRELGIISSLFPTLSAADAAAVAANAPLVIAGQYVLTAHQTLNANEIVIKEGSITLGAYNLTVNGTKVTAPNKRWLICNSSGAVSFAKTNVVSELLWFAVADGVTDDSLNTAAWNNSAPLRKASAGSYVTDTITINLFAQATFQGITGDGIGKTIFISRLGADLFTFAASAKLNQLTIDGFSVIGQGAGVGSGYAIYIPPTISWAYFVQIRNIFTSQLGGGCIKDAFGFFTSCVSFCGCDSCGGHAFDMIGGNTSYMEECYPHNLAAGKAGYRIHGTMTLRSCNGIDSGDFWGIFGNNTSDVSIPAGVTGGPYTIPADATTSYSHVVLEGTTNVEAFRSVGIVVKNGSISLRGNSQIQAPTTGTVVAFYIVGAPVAISYGVIDNYGAVTTKGAAWYQSCPIHVAAVSQQYFSYIGYRTATYIPIYDIAASTTRHFSTYGLGYVGYLHDGIASQAILTKAIKPDALLMALRTPTSAADYGLVGEINWSAAYVYVCTATNTWARIRHQSYNENVTTTGTISLTVGTDAEAQYFSTTLTGNLTVNLSTTGAWKGDKFQVTAPASLGGNTMTVGGKSMTANQWIEFRYSGSAWQEVCAGTLI